MAGLIVTLIASAIMAIAGLGVLSRWQTHLDYAEKLGTAGLFGLGITGTLIGLGGLVLGPNWPLTTLVFLIPGIYLAFKNNALAGLKPTKPEGPQLIALAGICLLFLFPLIATLAPSTALDWDTLAYHLAVPKIWLQTGSFQPLLWEHHSYFPAAFDALYVPGLAWGGQSGAKAFMLVALLFSCLAVFGLARRLWGAEKAWFAPILLAGSPVVLWESGTAYIDVPHGVLAVLAVWYFAEAAQNHPQIDAEPTPNLHVFAKIDPNLIIGSLLLALSLGSKYTGLQAFALLGVIYILFNLKSPKKLVQGVVIASLAALLIAGGWYFRNAALTGNPVRPFFSSIFPTKGWDQWRADTYANEQQTFGLGRTEKGRDPLQIGNAVLGLATQPGRFVNPAQTEGGGFPFGAVGVATMVILLCAATTPLPKTAKILLAWTGLLLIAWFFLSQQSRYMTYLPAAAALLLPAVMSRWKQLAIPLATITIAQAIYSAWMLYSIQAQDQLRVVTGQISADDYLNATTAFAPNAKEINQLADVTKLALYDELFGFLLDKPYFWANPGHTTENSVIPFQTGEEYVHALPQKPSHLYMSISQQFLPKEARDKFLATAGLAPGEPYTEQEKQDMFANEDLKWRWLIADAARSGAISVEKTFRSAILFKVN